EYFSNKRNTCCGIGGLVCTFHQRATAQPLIVGILLDCPVTQPPLHETPERSNADKFNTFSPSMISHERQKFASTFTIPKLAPLCARCSLLKLRHSVPKSLFGRLGEGIQ